MVATQLINQYSKLMANSMKVDLQHFMPMLLCIIRPLFQVIQEPNFLPRLINLKLLDFKVAITIIIAMVKLLMLTMKSVLISLIAMLNFINFNFQHSMSLSSLNFINFS